LGLIPHFSNRPPQPHLFYPGDQSGRLDAQVPQLGGTEQITQTFPNRRPFVDYADNRAILIHGLAPGTPPNLSGKQAERFVSRIIQSRIDRIEQFFSWKGLSFPDISCGRRLQTVVTNHRGRSGFGLIVRCSDRLSSAGTDF
jgi:hypothetical protein